MLFNLIFFDTLDSTQNEALRRIELSNVNTIPDVCDVIIAHHQINGRGRHGKRWISSEISKENYSNTNHESIKPFNLYLTIILNDIPFYQDLMYSGAIFVKEFLCSYFKENFKQEKISIKAPNDVMIDGKKVAGILIEKSFPFILMGIGVNIWSYPADCDQPVTCLIESLMLAKIDKSQFLLELSHQSTIQKLLSFCKLNLVKYALTR